MMYGKTQPVVVLPNARIKGYTQALELYLAIRKLTIPLEGWVHLDQLLRASSSVGANIAEGAGYQRTPYGLIGNTAHHYAIACGSLRETSFWLELGCLEGTLDTEQATTLELKIAELLKVITEVIFDCPPPWRGGRELDMPSAEAIWLEEEEA